VISYKIPTYKVGKRRASLQRVVQLATNE
jgi:hypothetical protein